MTIEPISNTDGMTVIGRGQFLQFDKVSARILLIPEVLANFSKKDVLVIIPIPDVPHLVLLIFL